MNQKATHGQHCICHCCHPHTLRPLLKGATQPAQSPQMRAALDVWAMTAGGLRSGS